MDERRSGEKPRGSAPANRRRVRDVVLPLLVLTTIGLVGAAWALGWFEQSWSRSLAAIAIVVAAGGLLRRIVSKDVLGDIIQFIGVGMGIAAMIVTGETEDTGPGAICSQTQCNGQNPGATGCFATRTSEHINVTNDQGQVGGWVELRWSDPCQTNWARVQNTSARADLELEAYLRDGDGRILEPTRVRGRGRGIYGPMWYAPTGEIAVSACGVIEGYGERCTLYH